MKQIFNFLFFFGFALSVQGQTVVSACDNSPDFGYTFTNAPSGNVYIVPEQFDTFAEFNNSLFIGEAGDYSASAGFMTSIQLWIESNLSVMYVYDGLTWDLIDSVQFEISLRPQICLVTPSINSDLIEIRVDSATMVGYDQVKIEWESLGTWTVIDSLDKFVSLSLVTNKSANTASYQFRTTVEGCLTSQAHRTIHLQMTDDDLSWNAYEGIDSDFFQGYFIWKRDVGSSDFTKIDSTSSLTYTDASWQSGDSYLVEAIRLDGCNTAVWSGKVEELSESSMISNIYSDLVGLSEFQLPKIILRNPSDHVALKLDREAQIKLYDLTGREVYDYGHTDKVEDHTVGAGLYLIKATDRSNYQIVKRLIIQ
jgi:hypothetical protein